MPGDWLVFFVNGKKVDVENPDPEMTLLQYLRVHSTVATCFPTLYVSHYSVVACLTPLCAVHGQAVTTIEGIGSLSTRLHPVQERLALAHGTQCGFCSPGFVMAMYTLLRNHPVPTAQQLETSFDGNLCRCTGYRPIVDGFRPFTQDACPMGDNCCKNKNGAINGLDEQVEQSRGVAFPGTSVYDPSQEPIFPPYLKTHGKQLCSQSVSFVTDRMTWYRPTSLKEVVEIKKKHPDCKFVVGNTEIVQVALTHVPELLAVEYLDTGIRFGASVSLATLEHVLKQAIRDLSDHKTKVFSAVVDMLRWFGSAHVRNVASIGGNIMTASPISDLNPLWMACGAILQYTSTEDEIREVVMDNKFITGYRQSTLLPCEILLSVCVPFTQQNEYFYGFKQAQRKEDDTSIVNAGIRVLLGDDSKVQDATFVFGGMAPITVMATKTGRALIGREWDEELLDTTCRLLAEELPLSPEAPGGMIQYRRSLTVSFFFKVYLDIVKHLKAQNKALNVPLRDSYLSAIQPMDRELACGTQVFETVLPEQEADDAVHRPLMHQSAFKQVTGEAIYVDDIPIDRGELYMGYVLSTHAHARLINVDPSAALGMDGVVDYVCWRDVPGPNAWGDGNFIFAKDEVCHQGQLIGGVLALSKTLAQRAAAAVVVEYAPLEAVITIKDAIAKQAFYPVKHNTIQRGDIGQGFAESDHVVEGELEEGAQEHFYLETNVSLVRPGEDGEMEVYSSTQMPAGIQESVAKALNVSVNKIVVRTKRVGGAFGGKQSRANVVALPLAVAAKKWNRAVRLSLDRDQDMMMTGTSHPLLITYKVGVKSDGKLQAVEITTYVNAGASIEISQGIVDKTMFNTDNCYNVPHLKTTGHLCKTNIPSCCALRGFGCPQIMAAAETWIAHVAFVLNMTPEKVREINFYQEGDKTHYNQTLEHVTLQRCWQECMEMSNFRQKRQEVDAFNRQNRWRKRGLALVPTKYGMVFTAFHLNQGGAVVHIYKDGSVLLSHGGVEMGQGLHTKMIQVASRVLGLPTSQIVINESSTNVIPNATVTAASMSSDIYGEAVKDACEKLRQRLDEYKKSLGGKTLTWKQLITSAYMDRINLSASGFYMVPDLDYDFDTNQGRVFSYYCFGVACSEVEVDCLTGDHKVLQTDIVVDAGKSLNPAVDIGQVEGAFIQGYGFMMLERYKVRPDGTLLTRGPGTYKIPTMGDIPAQFNVSLLKDSCNPRSIYSSRNTAESPLFLAASILHATLDAVMSARRDANLSPFVVLNIPATPDKIRLACADQFTKLFDDLSRNGPTTPWFVDL